MINKWLLINIPIIAVIILGLITGHLIPVFNDVTYITHTIAIYVVSIILYTGYTSWKLDNVSYVNSYKLYKYLNQPNFASNFVVTCGFLGTIIGVIIGFHYFPADAFQNPDKMADFIRQMLVGFSVELNSLVMGVFGKLWISLNIYIQENKIEEILHDTQE